jgi:predicted Fe-S protein YdhL (DUF1289 family)
MTTKTECVRRCQIKNSRCLGCKRTIDEIIEAGNKNELERKTEAEAKSSSKDN